MQYEYQNTKKEVLRASTSFSRSIYKSKVTQRECNFVIM